MRFGRTAVRTFPGAPHAPPRRPAGCAGGRSPRPWNPPFGARSRDRSSGGPPASISPDQDSTGGRPTLRAGRSLTRPPQHGSRSPRSTVRTDGRTVEATDAARHFVHPLGGGTWHVGVPDVSIGTVVETVYDVARRDPRFIPPWRFAGSLPTRRSEYAVVAPPGFILDFRFTRDGTFEEGPPERFETDEGVRFFWSHRDLDPIYPEERMPTVARTAPAAHVLYASASLGGELHPGFFNMGRRRGVVSLPTP